MNATTCKQCGNEVIAGQYATNKKFCSTACYKQWWKDHTLKASSNSDRTVTHYGEAEMPVALNEVQAAWLAAVVDGEGTIGLYRINNQGRIRYAPTVSVSNTNFEFVKRISDLVDGAVSIHNTSRAKKKGHRVCYILYVRRRAVAPFLRAILPHLIIKVRQAETLLRFFDVQGSAPAQTPSDHELYEHFYHQMKALNKRGSHD